MAQTPLPVSDWEDKPLEEAFGLPGDWYTSPQLFQLEQERIFRRTWQLVGRTEQVAEPGMYFTTKVANEPVLVVRGRDGVLRALSNVCRHRASPVALGCGKRNAFQCPYHGWVYDLDGRGRTAQGMNGAVDFDPAELQLPELHVDTVGPWVFAAVEEPPPLSEVLAPLIGRLEHYGVDELRYVGGRRWTFPANWKAYVDNYLEGYHLPFVHPAFTNAVDFEGFDPVNHRWMSEFYGREPNPRGPGSRVMSVLGNMQEFRRIKPPMPQLEGDEAKGYYFFFMFPLTTFNPTPDGIFVMTIRPVDHRTTESVWEWWMPQATTVDQRILQAMVVNFGHVINEEDTDIVIRCQEGLESSAFPGGRYCPSQESCLHHFHGLVLEHLNRTEVVV